MIASGPGWGRQKAPRLVGLSPIPRLGSVIKDTIRCVALWSYKSYSAKAGGSPFCFSLSSEVTSVASDLICSMGTLEILMSGEVFVSLVMNGGKK